jgi:hypothetical protein
MEDNANGLGHFCMVFISVSWMFFFSQVVQEYECLVVFRLGEVKKGGAQDPALCPKHTINVSSEYLKKLLET